MNSRLNYILQSVAVFLQGFNFSSMPQKWQMPTALVIGLFQAVVSGMAQYKNPDGTPASVAYEKEK